MTVSVLHAAQPRDGGVAHYLVAGCLDQLSRGWRVAVACPDGGWLADELARVGVPRLRWPAVRSPGPAAAGEAARLRSLVAQVRPDVVHLHASKAGLAGRLRPFPRIPILFQPHGWSWLAVGGALRTASLAWERSAARRTDLLLCVGDGEAEQGRAQGVQGRYAVVRNGVDLSRFRPAFADARAGARHRLGVPAQVPLVVCPGRLTRQKGQDVLLSAWPLIRSACPSARLALLGDGDLAGRLRAAATPGVTFAGAVDDVRGWLAAADVVALPSRWEGLSLTVLEAMATARPVVISDVPGLAEALGPGTGAAVPPGDPVLLAEAIAQRLLDPARREAEGMAAAAHAVHFDMRRTFDHLAERTEAVLR